MEEPHPIKIKPTLVGTDLDTFNRKLGVAEAHMKRIMNYASKITIPGVSGGAGGGGVAPGVPGAGGGGTNASQTASQYAQQAMPPRARRVHRGRFGGANATMNSGQFLTNFQSVIEPILPQLDQMMMPGGGGKSAVSKAIQQHLARLSAVVQSGAPGSQAESFAIARMSQATGIAPEAVQSAVAGYRAYQQGHGGTGPLTREVSRAYFSAQQAATRASGGGGAGGVTNVVKRLATAAGAGEMAGLLGGGLTATGIGAAALGVGFVASQVKQGWSTYHTQGTAFSALSKTIGDLGESFNTLRNRVDATSVGFAESLPTITAATQALAPYVGNVGTGGLTRYMTASQGMAYSMGLNPVSTAQSFGQAAQMGILGTNSTSGQLTANQFAALIGNAVSAGSMQGRQGQVLSAMLSVSQQLAAQLGQAPNATLLAGIMTSLNKSGNAVLQGTMGAQVLSSINQGIQSPGLGPAGALATYQALNPTGALGYFQEQYLQSQGINGRNPITGQSNFSAIMQYFQKMLPGGRVTGTTKNGIWMPSEQSAAVGALMGQDLHLTQSQALNVLKAMQGRSVSQENATQALANQLGPGALNAIIKKGGIYELGAIANATGVGGKNGLNAVAHQIVHTLHGHVSRQYYTELHQYQQLGRIHPRNLADAHSIQHQRALDLAQMKTTLGHSLQTGPKLGTSLDNLNSTIAKAEKNWASIARNLTPIREQLSKLNGYLSGGLARTLGGAGHTPPTPGQIMNLFNTGGTGATMAYRVPGLPSASSGGSLGATLASFVQGNNQQTYLSALMTLMRNGGGASSGSGGGVIPAGYITGGSAPTNLRPYVSAAQAAMRQARAAHANLTPGVSAYNRQISNILGTMPNRNPHLTPALIDAVMTQQDASGNPYAYNLDSNGTMDAGLMQINSSNWAKYGLTSNPYNVTANLTAGIQMLNQLLNQSGGNIYSAAYHYAGSGPLATQEANQLMSILAKIEKNTRSNPYYAANQGMA
ncbi:transglycosylase SLT domain-containing protein [Sulfobacillus harzensis]|uniref:Transglycosylase SLT domain-containing protein n=1 Tax=Sulfobacillus harzensis TaxID=2729629 RepID=A0A7Y0L1U1_9FIRM|nr:transglycosylase SLT domain-containing protein [Sulfobacillus harzensis]NMP20775.1 transglycosylase SLT domain-containing protein [Sulfobacillus harzensis]